VATYKLIQDIEAEDHILGPLSFRQFVFALIAVFLFYMSFLVIAKHVPFLLVIFLPPALFFGFFALPFGRDQPTEIWALAKLRFLFLPRKRIWDQSGVKELVTITVPKKIEHVYTDGLSQSEVKSRLSALATTLDSRGWAVKNASGDGLAASGADSDRLVSVGSFPQEVSSLDVRESDDILDEANNPIAQQFESMIDASAQARRQEVIDEMNGVKNEQAQTPQPAAPAPTNDLWFMAQATADDGPQPAAPAAQAETAEEIALAAQMRAQNNSQQASYSHMRTVQPIGNTPVPAETSNSAVPPAVTATPDPAILSLANNNDLNVSTLAREASKAKGDSPDEVVISLH
jgi:hypothetical protein